MCAQNMPLNKWTNAGNSAKYALITLCTSVAFKWAACFYQINCPLLV